MHGEPSFPSHERSPRPKIETIEGPRGSSVSVSPERGGIITSLKLAEKEILYLNPETFDDPTKNVKGGIPILFPNAGPIEHPNYPGLKQHGFARTSNQWQFRMVPGRAVFTESLASNEETRAMFPHDFQLIIKGQFTSDRSFALDQTAVNVGNDTLPLAMGLHPYFKVAAADRANVRFDFPGGEEIEARREEWMNGTSVSIDNPQTEQPSRAMTVRMPGIGTLLLDASREYQKIWVWSMPDADFVCIEPVMRNSGGLVNDPEQVAPGETISGHLSIALLD